MTTNLTEAEIMELVIDICTAVYDCDNNLENRIKDKLQAIAAEYVKRGKEISELQKDLLYMTEQYVRRGEQRDKLETCLKLAYNYILNPSEDKERLLGVMKNVIAECEGK